MASRRRRMAIPLTVSQPHRIHHFRRSWANILTKIKTMTFIHKVRAAVLWPDGEVYPRWAINIHNFSTA
jgi:hypothetical protein